MIFFGKERQQRRRSFVLQSEQLEHRTLLAADMVAHWRAQDFVANTADGSIVEEWVDSIGGVVGVGSGVPVLSHTAVGGRAGIQFDSADGPDLIGIPSSSSPLRNAKDFSIAVVFSTSSGNLDGGNDEWFKNSAIVDSSSLGFAIDWGISINQVGQVSAGLGSGFGSPPRTLYSPVAGLNDGETHVAILSRAGTGLSLRLDDASAVIRDDASDFALSNLALTFGAQKSGSFAFNGYIAEVRVFNGALDDAAASDLYSEVIGFYDNKAPTAENDEYSLEEDSNLFYAGAINGVLSNDTDPESDPLVAVLVDSTKHGQLTFNEDGSFFYDPDQNFFGADTFTYSAIDFRPSSPATVTLNVSPVYDSVIAQADIYKAIPGEILEVDIQGGLLANDINHDLAELSAQLKTPVGNGLLDLRPNGSFTYDPQGFAGVTTFEYQVDDGQQLSNTSVVTLTVNTPPQAVQDDLSVNEDMRLSSLFAMLLENDTDPDGNVLTAEIIDLPKQGILEGEGAEVSYLPNPDFFGVDSLTYQVSDGVDESTIVTAVLTVQPVNDVPVSISDAYIGRPNEIMERPAHKGVLANDFDIDSESLTAVLAEGPSNGTLQLGDDGSFVYNPNPGFLGKDQFSYRVNDSIADSPVATVDLLVTATPVTISEFMATNSRTLETKVRYSVDDSFFPDKLSPDWIELENKFAVDLDISRMHLTDDPDLLTKWRFPEGTMIPANGRLIVYASGLDLSDPALDSNGRLHTNFNLRADGEYLAFTLEDGTVVHEFESYPNQRADTTYGLFDGSPQFFTTPTPLAENTPGISGAVSDTSFSINRGFFSEPFTTDITTATVGATLVYTTDGSKPTLENGTRVEAENADVAPVVSIEIIETTTLRAAAFKAGLLPTNIDTQSYFFVADLVEQRFSAQVENHPEWGAKLGESLTSLPVVSLVMDGRVSLRENETSVELIFPNGEEPGFQVNAGVEHYGGHSINSPKKNMRLSFKSQYGDGSLNYDLYGEGATSEFNQILLRSGSHDTWFWTHPAGGRGNYVRNRWAFDRQLEMGQPAPHGRFVQVFINGRYWGMHHLMERPNADFMASYEGGRSFEYDAVNAGTPINGDNRAWRKLQDRNVISDYNELQQWLDVENYVDYMLLQFYSGNDWDWNHSQNWSAARKREDGAGYVFFAWDSDVILRTTATANVINRGGPGGLWSARGGVKQHDEVKMIIADRAQKYFFNGGMFTDERLRADVNAIADQIRLPVIAETGRWGGRSYTPDTWESAIKWMLDRFAPEGSRSRAVTTIDQMRRYELFPLIDAPSFLVDGSQQNGGDIPAASQVSISADEGDIYYGLNGVDPRLPGGELNPEASLFAGDGIQLDETAIIKARARKDGEWSALMEARFRVDTVPANSTNLRISEIHYHPVDVTPEELAAGYSDADDFEFIEFVNTSSLTIDLTSVRLERTEIDDTTHGVDFEFSASEVTELGPGERVVVVEDTDAFTLRYGDGIRVAGQWSGALSNAGETITAKAGDEIIHQFAYSDEWYSATDGNGPSLQIIDELGALDRWLSRESWRPSSQLGGTPGMADEAEVDIPGDANRDGVFNSTDLVQVFQAGEYEDGIAGNSTWEEGDWDNDQEFTTTDLVVAFQAGWYVAAASPVLIPKWLFFETDEQRKQRFLSRESQPASTNDQRPESLELSIVDKLFESI